MLITNGGNFMFLKFAQKPFTNYPEEYKDAFISKIENSNYLRGKYFSYVLIFVSLLMVAVAILSDDMMAIKIVNLGFFIMSGINAILFSIPRTSKVNTSIYRNIIVAIEVFTWIAWSSTLIVLIPVRLEFLTTYSVVILSVTALMLLRWQTSLIFFSLSTIYIVVLSMGRFPDPVLPKISTLFTLVVVAWLISRLLYNKEMESFKAEKVLERKSLIEQENKRILEESNLKLMEANSKIKTKTDELVRANEQLKISEQEAKIANAVKTDFLARMSHDMRTPLTALIGLSDFGIEEQRDDKDVEYFTKMKDSSEYLLSLVNDTLDLQKLESSNIELNYSVEECSSATKKVQTIMGLESANKGVNLVNNTESSSCKGYIKRDEKRVKQILINILSNAIKYTPEGGTVIWENSVIHLDDDNIIQRNVITDNGVGMSKEYMKLMYEPFSKEHSSLSNSESSTGLGLAICKNLVEIMGGSIECESELGKGTKFTIDIPQKYAKKQEIETYLKEKDSIEHIAYAEGKKALICEDSKINAHILSKILGGIGIVSEYAENGLEGLKLARENDYDVIFMDIRMPVMDGLTATTEIRKFDSDTPIIALSANAYEEDIEKSIEAGMNAHLSKPFDKRNIFKELTRHL